VKRIAIIAVIAVVVIAFIAIAGMRVKASIDRNAAASNVGDGKPPSVAVAIAEKKDLPLVVSITGVVRAQNEAVVFAKMPGRVTRIAVEVGQAVKAGDVLAVLEANDLAWRVKQAEAQVKQAQAGLENAKVQQKTATSSWERAQALHGKKATSDAEFEQAEAGFHLAGVGVQAAEAQVALAEAALGLANQAFADSRITTPIAGVVAKKNVDMGAQANPGQAAFVVQDQSSLKVQGSVPASDVARLKKGQSVRISVDELPGRLLEGQLSSIAPTLDSDTRRALVEVGLKPAEGLLPYMFGHAEIDFGRQEGVLVVPAAAVVATADGAVVYAVKDGKVKLVKPKLAGRVENEFVVEDGLSAGDRVIVSGDTGLRDGIAVAVAGES
jgi:RND family efflux transporter MFP subunit